MGRGVAALAPPVLGDLDLFWDVGLTLVGGCRGVRAGYPELGLASVRTAIASLVLLSRDPFTCSVYSTAVAIRLARKLPCDRPIGETVSGRLVSYYSGLERLGRPPTDRGAP